MSDPLRASKELLGRLTNRLCTTNKDDDGGADDTKCTAGSGENGAQDGLTGQHWIYRNARNALNFGGAFAGKAGDVMSRSSAVIRTRGEAAGKLGAEILSKANGFLTSNISVNADKGKPGGPHNEMYYAGSCANGEHHGVAGEHWIYRNRKLLGAAAVGAGAVVAAPMVLAAAGFGPTGITAGSLGAGMMSKSAITGLGAGVVSTLQSAGAAGIAGSTKVLIAGVTGGISLAAGKRGKNGDEGGSNPPKVDAATNTETIPTAEAATETAGWDKIPASRL